MTKHQLSPLQVDAIPSLINKGLSAGGIGKLLRSDPRDVRRAVSEVLPELKTQLRSNGKAARERNKHV